jgi:hypothetical protein
MATDSHRTNGDHRERELDAEIERYREAAAAALEQLQWAINYLHRIRKGSIAGRLERNRSQILKQAKPGPG